MMAMKDLSRRFKQQLAEFLEIPGDIILDLPKVILLGNLKLVVENHRGILKYSAQVIQINIPEGELIIEGKGLQLQSIRLEEICVEGQIKSVTFIGEES
jgi:sporulation protein YqfC